MNTEKLEKLKKSLDNKFIPDNVKDKIRNEIEKLESEIKSEEISATELKKEVAKVEDKVEVAVDKSEKKAESNEPKKGRGRPRKTPATTSVEPKATETAIKKTAMVVAKTIRKDGEKWNDAMKRANGVMKKEKVEVKKTTKSELDRLLARVRKNKSLMSDLKGVKDLGRDAVRKAKPVGKRMSESGNVYYEYRANKTDRKTYGKYAFAGGGNISDVTSAIFNPNQKNGKIETSFGNKTKEGLFVMISNVNYSPEEISKAIFDSNDKNGKIKTTYGDKTLAGFTEMIKNVRNTFAGGGSLTKYVKVYVVQGNYGYGWDDLTYHENFAEAKKERKVYDENENNSHRVITRNVLRTDYEKGNYELGGSVVTDLAGHTGGSLGTGNKGMLDGFSNTAYTGLVGETGAMSSGEMFMSGGGVGMANQQVIDDASQGYVNYYLGEGASAGIYKDGGAIENQYIGKTPEQIWNMLSISQRYHFLQDHRKEIESTPASEEKATKTTYKFLPQKIKNSFKKHIEIGQYAKGGGVRKVGNREYSYGRNWTNDHEHVNQSEEHEVNYTRKGKFLGVFAKGGGVEDEIQYGSWYVKIKKDKNDEEIRNQEVARLIREGYFSGFYPSWYLKITDIEGDIDEATEQEIARLVEEGYTSGEIVMYKNNYAKGGGVRQVGNREYSTGRNWTNDHRHTNKSEEHEVNYNRKRFFAGGGGVDDDTPKIYVADLEAYNNGRLSGVWLDLTDYSDADELMDAINDFLKTTGGEEYAVHDYENLPRSMYSEYMGVRDFEEIYEMLDLAKENDLPLDVVMEVVSQFDRSALDEYTGVYDSEQDFAEQLVDDIGITSFIDFEYYLEISETDRRLMSQEMADGYVDDIRDEDGGNRLIEEAGLDVDEYEEADSERQEEMLDEAREIVYDNLYNDYYNGLNDPYNFLVEEQGLYDADSFANANFVRVDYEKLGDALEQDYTFIRHDGQIYVFNIR
jgi:antirestriction protein